MSEQPDRRADSTRLQILRAASRQFAHKPYSLVSLDDILADAAVTKGALYFHFRSKYALASAIVDHRAAAARATIEEVLARNLSGLETLIDISFQLALDDIGAEMARAGLNLIESIGRTDSLGPHMLGSWVQGLAEIGRRAVTEGDLAEDSDPSAVACLLVALHMGIRQTSNLDDPQRFLADFEQAWKMMLPGLVSPDRLRYLAQFIQRRTAVAIKKAVPLQHTEPERQTDPRAGSV